MPKFEVINSCCNKTGTKFLDFTPADGQFWELLRLFQFSLVVIRSAKRYDLVKKESYSAYDFVAGCHTCKEKRQVNLSQHATVLETEYCDWFIPLVFTTL